MPFGRFDEEVRDDLRTARQQIIPTLIATARHHALAHILVAGDMFDQETPSLRLIRQTLSAMAEAPELTWWIIPGNHDSLKADMIWQVFADHAAENIRVQTKHRAVEMADGVWLLPAPCTARSPGYDLTEFMADQPTPDGAFRIGLAHGAVVDFRPDEPSAETIPPTRADTARLDYLALGDWHGALQVSANTWYSGAPEHDRFKHSGRGVGLIVTLPHPGGTPQVEKTVLGKNSWHALDLNLTPGMDPITALGDLLPGPDAPRRNTLLRLRLAGHLHLQDRMTLQSELERIAPEYCHFEWNDRDLRTEYKPGDLNEIAHGGALRIAAESLKAEVDDPDLTRDDRDIAEAALSRLYGLVKAHAK